MLKRFLLFEYMIAAGALGLIAACGGGSAAGNNNGNDAAVSGDASLVPDGSSGVDNDQDGYPADQDCDDDDPTVYPGVRRDCQSECDVGTEVCLTYGTWNTCTARTDCDCTNPGDTRLIDCGNCGQASQECGLDLRWSMPGECLGQGECAAGATEQDTCPLCGTAIRQCNAQCTWGAWEGCYGECEPGEDRVTSQGCANPWERQIQQCDADCGWSATVLCGNDCLLTARTGTPDYKDEICIPAGRFVMGCDTNECYGWTLSMPKHIVALSAYYIDQYEVTVGRYRECVLAGACTEPAPGGLDPSTYFQVDSDDLPVNYVDYDQAESFCAWDGGRTLPSEAQWEKAARGPEPSESLNPWGDAAATCAEVPAHDCPGYERIPQPVGSHPAGASVYGVHNLGGNVRESVLDYLYDYSDSGPVPLDPVNLVIPTDGSRVSRSGSFFGDLADHLFTTPIRFSSNGLPSPGRGFRCARPGY